MNFKQDPENLTRKESSGHLRNEDKKVHYVWRNFSDISKKLENQALHFVYLLDDGRIDNGINERVARL